MILSKRPNLMIRKLSEMLVPRRNRSPPIKPDDNNSASPRSPLDLKFPSPVTSKRFDSRGIGLGIVAALEETSIGINRYDLDLSSEEYTLVRSSNGSTKVYYNEDGFELCEKDDHRRVQKVIEPPVIKRESCRNQTEFLSSCCLCKKKLHGKDIYMYKGEMGFCSIECRSVQIMNDERQEQCQTQVSRNVDVLSSNNNTAGAGIFVF